MQYEITEYSAETGRATDIYAPYDTYAEALAELHSMQTEYAGMFTFLVGPHDAATYLARHAAAVIDPA